VTISLYVLTKNINNSYKYKSYLPKEGYTLEQKEKEVEQMIENLVSKYVKQYTEQFLGQTTAELRNENGNATIRQSGNGIVYVDNTGIAYAMVLFYYHFMPKEYRKEIDIENILQRLDGIIGENRKIFTDAVQLLKDE
jgi:hypothetical protein